MSYETITVRMNRSDPSIRWGFTLRQQGNRIVVNTVDKDSLSDKAGMQSGDEVDAVCGRNALNMSVNEANSILDGSYQEVNFNLRRYVTSHTCLPWTLTEKDNKLVVDDVQPGYGSGYGGSRGIGMHGRSTSAHTKSSFQTSNQQRNAVVPYNSSYQSNYVTQSSTRTPHRGSYVATNSQPRFYQSPSAYSRRQESSYNKTNSVSHDNRQFPSYSTHTKTNYTSVDNSTPVPFGTGTKTFHHVNPTYTTNFGAQRHRSESETRYPTAAQNYSYNNGVTTSAYKSGAGGLPLNQATYIQTSQLSPTYHPGGVSPGGTKVLYHSPSPRTRQELSPYASVQHLQYNSPMNIYSVEAAAEQYTQQTGRPTELPHYPIKSPAYLTSETKKLIEEQERGRGYHRVVSPSAQSSSFKRISQAVGEPVI
ncbi:PDZ/DHR/GLGF domain protein [Oesophagostomum dentatum]|uniref:PDZ/DHR/GLGF domain protein n=1 Tax=Oesophagostomum dentatum TaxID=61180 RepID=A0A0B1T773_OESDE|nr:PDZ/DHR/GLGF domain protein [Oesophagostomum dentatum]